MSVSRFLDSLRTRLTQLHPSANCSLRDDHMVHVHFKEEIGIAELIPLVTTYIILFAYIYFSTRESVLCIFHISLSCPVFHHTFLHFTVYLLFFSCLNTLRLLIYEVPTVQSHASHCALGCARVFVCEVCSCLVKG